MENNETFELLTGGFNNNEMLMSDDGSCYSCENGEIGNNVRYSEGDKGVNLSKNYNKVSRNEPQNNFNEIGFNSTDLTKGNNGDYIRVPERSKSIRDKYNDKSYNIGSSYIDRNFPQVQFPPLVSEFVNNHIMSKHEKSTAMLPMKIKDKVRDETLIKENMHSSNHTSLKLVDSRKNDQKSFNAENSRMRSDSNTFDHRNNISDLNFENSSININGYHGRAVKHNVSFFRSPSPPKSQAQFYSADRNIKLPSMRRGLNISKVSYTEDDKDRSGEVMAGEISFDSHNNIKLDSSDKVYRESELRSFIKQDNLTSEISRYTSVIDTENDSKRDKDEYRKHYIPTKKPTISLAKRNRKISVSKKGDDLNKIDQGISSKTSEMAPTKSNADESIEYENGDSIQPDIFSSQLLIKYGMIRSSKLDIEKHDDDEDVPERSKSIREKYNDKSYNIGSSYIDRNFPQVQFPPLVSEFVNNHIMNKHEESTAMLPMKIKDKVRDETLIKENMHSSNHTSLKLVDRRKNDQKSFNAKNSRMRSDSNTFDHRKNISDLNFENSSININGHHGRAVKHNVSFFRSPSPPKSQAQFYSADRNIKLPSMRRGLNISKVSYTEDDKDRSGEVMAGEISFDSHNNIKLDSSDKVYRESELRSFIKQDNLTSEISRYTSVIDTENDSKRDKDEYRKHYIPTKKPTISLAKRNRKISVSKKGDDLNKIDQGISSKTSEMAPTKSNADESIEYENGDSIQPDIFSSQLLIKYGMIRSSKLDIEKHDDDEDGNYQSNSISNIHTSKNSNVLGEHDRKIDEMKETRTTSSKEKAGINFGGKIGTVVNEKTNIGAKQYGTGRNKLNIRQVKLSKSEEMGTDKNDAKEEIAKVLAVGTSDKASRLRTPSGRSFIIKPKMMKLKSSINSAKRPESKHYGNKTKQEKGLVKKQTVIIRRNVKKSPRLVAIEQHVKRTSILENILAIKGKKIGANGKRTKASEFVNLKSGIENSNKSSKKTVPYPGSAEDSVETVSKKSNGDSFGAFNGSTEKKPGISKQGNASRDNFRKNIEKLGLVKKQNKKAEAGVGGLKATGSEDEVAEKSRDNSTENAKIKVQKSTKSPLRTDDMAENGELDGKKSGGMMTAFPSIRYINKDNLKSPILASNFLARVEEPFDKNLELINGKILGNKMASGFRLVNLKPKTPNNSISEIEGIKSYLEYDKNDGRYYEQYGKMGLDAIDGGIFGGRRTIDSKTHSMNGPMEYEKHHNVDGDFDAGGEKIVTGDNEMPKRNVAKLDNNNYKLLAISDGLIMNKKKPSSKPGKLIDKSMISPPLKVDKSANSGDAGYVKEGDGNGGPDAVFEERWKCGEAREYSNEDD
ncbi:hypothetical protein AYI69_g3569 [Smittium culicis]|uniref:Uncharacterized protein n=1 Tax=Smittium culicis TaxID=133412 RepID=A0A1R1YJB8_9FUNG|nr:hypothetical protein AYI69_g3569 [Smittium culicis]